MSDAADSFRGTDTVSIVGVADCCSVGLCKGLKLTSLLPSERMTEIRRGVALCIIGDGVVTYCGKLILPCCITVGICNTVLRQDITVVVASERITVGEILLPPTVSSLKGKNVTVRLEKSTNGERSCYVPASIAFGHPNADLSGIFLKPLKNFDIFLSINQSTTSIFV